MDPKLAAFERILKVMDDLRAGCPWDKAQTMETLRHLTIEEVYELGDAILEGNMPEVKKELGDILLHIVFYSKIAEEQGLFNISDVIHQECEKLIHRHPHIYGNVDVADADEVSRNWEQLKLKEGKKSVLEGVPASLPSMVKAMRIQDKTSSAGFDWDHPMQVIEKVEEELQELKAELISGNKTAVKEEFGDLLFSLINYARFIDVNPDEALEKCNKKFIRRFKYMEEVVTSRGQQLHEMELKEMDAIWNEAKKLN